MLEKSIMKGLSVVIYLMVAHRLEFQTIGPICHRQVKNPIHHHLNLPPNTVNATNVGEQVKYSQQAP